MAQNRRDGAHSFKRAEGDYQFSRVLCARLAHMPSTAPTSHWYSKVNDEFTLPLPVAEANALCCEAVKTTKSMFLNESEDNRLLVKYVPWQGKNAKVEVLFSDAGGAATTVTLKGWFVGLGKSQLRRTVRKVREAIEEHAKQSASSLSPAATGS